MVSPLKDVRDRKRNMLIQIILVSLNLICEPRGSLDLMSYRTIDETLNNLKKLKPEEKPSPEIDVPEVSLNK